MPEVNRREFITAATVAAAGIALFGGCPGLCLAARGRATPGKTDAGPLADFKADGVFDKFANTNDFFVIRENGKLFAVSALCTHQGEHLRAKQTEFFCPKHDSTFAFDGEVKPGNKARRSLPRHAISLDDKSHVIVDTTQSFEEKRWDDPASFIKLEK
jgi:nitrite reductase/ring-hydroxylating ferredoxin subunit